MCGNDLAGAVWRDNRYHVPATAGEDVRWFVWGSRSLGFARWRSDGRDREGSLDTWVPRRG